MFKEKNTEEQSNTIMAVNDDNTKQVKKKKKRKRRIKNLLLRFIALLLFLVVLFHFVITVRVVHNNDMYPLLCDGQLVIVSKIGKINISEVVLYKINGREQFGRIIAQENDNVKISEEGLYINGNINYNFLPYPTKPLNDKDIDIQVPKNSYYVLNDYRERMNDSRSFGAVSDITGKVIFTMKYRGI